MVKDVREFYISILPCSASKDWKPGSAGGLGQPLEMAHRGLVKACELRSGVSAGFTMAATVAFRLEMYTLAYQYADKVCFSFQ